MLNQSASAAVSATNFDIRTTAPAVSIGNAPRIRRGAVKRDLVFAALAAESAAYEAFGAAYQTDNRVKIAKAEKVWFAAERKLFATAPTTHAGLAALLERLSDRTIGAWSSITTGNRTGECLRILVDTAPRLAGTTLTASSPAKLASLEAAE